MYAQEISASRFVELCLGVVVSETLSLSLSLSLSHTHTHTHTHAHTHTTLSPHFTNNFSLHTTLYTHATPSCTENDLRLLSFVPVYQHALYFPVRFSRREIENFYIVFPYSVKERVKQGYFSGCLKIHKMLLPK
jgi:hypothetical protein